MQIKFSTPFSLVSVGRLLLMVAWMKGVINLWADGFSRAGWSWRGDFSKIMVQMLKIELTLRNGQRETFKAISDPFSIMFVQSKSPRMSYCTNESRQLSYEMLLRLYVHCNLDCPFVRP
jgi:hypothetical protein